MVVNHVVRQYKTIKKKQRTTCIVIIEGTEVEVKHTQVFKWRRKPILNRNLVILKENNNKTRYTISIWLCGYVIYLFTFWIQLLVCLDKQTCRWQKHVYFFFQKSSDLVHDSNLLCWFDKFFNMWHRLFV